jgi:hypothetical protein
VHTLYRLGRTDALGLLLRALNPQLKGRQFALN